MHRRAGIRTGCLIFVAVASVPWAAAADPNPNSSRMMRIAFRTCKRAMDKQTASKRDVKDYNSYRDRALQRDASIKNWSGLIEGMRTDETLRKCDAFFAKETASASAALPSEKAQTLMKKAFNICLTLLSPSGQNRVDRFRENYKRYQRLRDEAARADAKIKDWTGRLMGRVVKSRLVECDETTAKILAGWEKQIDTSKKVQEQRREESRRQEAEKKRKFQALVKSLQGDRRRILAQEGCEPWDFKGKLQTARQWKYKTYPADRGPHWHCTTTYTFRGNKLVSKTRRGPYCH